MGEPRFPQHFSILLRVIRTRYKTRTGEDYLSTVVGAILATHQEGATIWSQSPTTLSQFSLRGRLEKSR